MNVNQAREFAIKAHGDQRYGGHPYVKHLDDVAGLVRPHSAGDMAPGVIAYLHDVIEDTTTTIDDIGLAFGYRTAMDVWWMSDPPLSLRSERKRALYQRWLCEPDRGAVVYLVKAADRLANVLECLKNNPTKLELYRGEHREFRAACYRPGLCDEIWAELDLKIRRVW